MVPTINHYCATNVHHATSGIIDSMTHDGKKLPYVTVLSEYVLGRNVSQSKMSKLLFVR